MIVRNIPRAVGEKVRDILSSLNGVIDTVNSAMANLDLLDNFESQEVDVTIAAGAEEQIRHNLQTVPRFRVIARESGATGGILDGDTAWTNEFIYLKNTEATPITVKVIIFK